MYNVATKSSYENVSISRMRYSETCPVSKSFEKLYFSTEVMRGLVICQQPGVPSRPCGTIFSPCLVGHFCRSSCRKLYVAIYVLQATLRRLSRRTRKMIEGYALLVSTWGVVSVSVTVFKGSRTLRLFPMGDKWHAQSSLHLLQSSFFPTCLENQVSGGHNEVPRGRRKSSACM